MQIVLDTCSLNYILQGRESCSIEVINDKVSKNKLSFVLDSAGALYGEWSENCGKETIAELVIKWNEFGNISLEDKYSNIEAASMKKLKALGFKAQTIDKLILKLALTLEDSKIVSNDSDLWNPKNKTAIGNKRAPVAKYLRDEHSIMLYLASDIAKAKK
ncbi:MAG: hypothetical protein KAR62_06540 [Sphingomonadales bacterium]|nr:hypothetical protein [Sphingomonadales bacterium]